MSSLGTTPPQPPPTQSTTDVTQNSFSPHSTSPPTPSSPPIEPSPPTLPILPSPSDLPIPQPLQKVLSPRPGRTFNYNQDIDLISHYGTPITDREPTTIRVFFQNTKVLTHSSTGEDYKYYLSLLADQIKSDISGMAETNTAWQHYHLRTDFKDNSEKTLQHDKDGLQLSNPRYRSYSGTQKLSSRRHSNYGHRIPSSPLTRFDLLRSNGS